MNETPNPNDFKPAYDYEAALHKRALLRQLREELFEIKDARFAFDIDSNAWRLRETDEGPRLVVRYANPDDPDGVSQIEKLHPFAEALRLLTGTDNPEPDARRARELAAKRSAEAAERVARERERRALRWRAMSPAARAAYRLASTTSELGHPLHRELLRALAHAIEAEPERVDEVPAWVFEADAF
jgi:hypothetical protein